MSIKLAGLIDIRLMNTNNLFISLKMTGIYKPAKKIHGKCDPDHSQTRSPLIQLKLIRSLFFTDEVGGASGDLRTR